LKFTKKPSNNKIHNPTTPQTENNHKDYKFKRNPESTTIGSLSNKLDILYIYLLDPVFKTPSSLPSLLFQLIKRLRNMGLLGELLFLSFSCFSDHISPSPVLEPQRAKQVVVFETEIFRNRRQRTKLGAKS
jgi:hypothetical protein